MTYSLLIHPTSGPPLEGKAIAPNPAMQRVNAVEFDEGRPWSGDLYTDGPVTDPAEAYAHFAGGEDTEAWLDRGEDGTLIGWVREGDAVYRYSDPEAWHIDVDGAGMSRTDAGPAADPAADPEAAQGAEQGAPAAPPVGGEPTGDEDPFDPDAPTAPEAFDGEDDPAVTEEDPTEEVEDPTSTDDAATEEASNPFDGLSDEDAALNEDPTKADPTAEDPTAEDPLADDPEADPADEPAEEPADEDELAAPEDAPEPEGEDDDEEDEEEKRKKLSAGVQGKHMPGQHNQEEHGNWAHGPGRILPRARRAATSSSTDSAPGAGGAPSAPKAGEAAPAKARLSTEDLAAMGDEDLAALMESDDLYDVETLIAAAEEYDRRDDPHDRTVKAAEKAEPGSPEEAAAFDSVISPAWAAWAATGGKGAKPSMTKQERIDAEWLDYWLGLMSRAEEELNGVFLRRGVTEEQLAARHLSVEDFFNARVARQRLKNLMSPELIDWLDANAISRRRWLAEFYPSYAKALRELGSGEGLGENH